MIYPKKPQLLTKLIQQWLFNRGMRSRTVPTSYSSVDLVRINNAHTSITVYDESWWWNLSERCVAIGFLYPIDPVWLDHRDPDFFGKLESALRKWGTKTPLYEQNT